MKVKLEPLCRSQSDISPLTGDTRADMENYLETTPKWLSTKLEQYGPCVTTEKCFSHHQASRKYLFAC